MSRGVVACAVFAPILIAIATTVVPPANLNYSQVSKLIDTASESADQLITATSESFAGESQRLKGLLMQTMAKKSETVSTYAQVVSKFRQDLWPRETLPPPSLGVALHYGASIDATAPAAVAAEVIPAELPVVAYAEPRAAGDLVVTARADPLPPMARAKETPPITLAEQPARLPLPDSPSAVPAETPVETPVVVAAVFAPAQTVEAAAVPQAAPTSQLAVVRADKPEEKQVFASLGPPAAALSDAYHVAADPLFADEARVVYEYKPSLAEPEDRYPDYASLDSPASPSHASNMPISSPLKLRALTRADIPTPEKFASLGSSALRSDAHNATNPPLSGIQPPEQQRVAYDAPAAAEQPSSIGKRRYVDDTKYTGLGSPEALLEALRHMGSNAKSLGLPASLWCADFMNLVLRKSGLNATGSRAAKSYLQYGKKIDEPRVGAIAIFSRGRNGGHIGIVRGTDGSGNPIIVSGNHNNKVAEAVYPKARVIAYVVPR